MLTTGKTTEEIPLFIRMNPFHASTGKPSKWSTIIFVDAKVELAAICAMDGSNNLIIRCFTRLANAKTKIVEKDLVQATTHKNKKE